MQQAQAYIETTPPCILHTSIKESKLVYSEPTCFDVLEVYLGDSQTGQLNTYLSPYFIQIFDNACFHRKIHLGVSIDIQESNHLQFLEIPLDGEIKDFVITEAQGIGLTGKKLFKFDTYSGSELSIAFPTIITDISESYSGNLLACEDLGVKIPIISDESNITPLENNSTHPSGGGNNIFIGILFVGVISIFFFFGIKKLRKKK